MKNRKSFKKPHNPLHIIALIGSIVLLGSCGVSVPSETWEDLVTNQIPVSVMANEIPNSEVWARVQGVHPPVPDNNPTFGVQHQQSPHRKLYEVGGYIPNGERIEIGQLVHAAEVMGYWPSESDPYVYILRSGGFYTDSGDYIAPCNFFAGVDSYAKVVLRGVVAERTIKTLDGEVLPLFSIGDWLVVDVDLEGRWWAGEVPWIIGDGFNTYPHTMNE